MENSHFFADDEDPHIFADNYLISLQQKLRNRALALAIIGENPDIASSLIREMKSSKSTKNSSQYQQKPAVIINLDQLTFGKDRVDFWEKEFNVGERQIRDAHHTL